MDARGRGDGSEAGSGAEPRPVIDGDEVRRTYAMFEDALGRLPFGPLIGFTNLGLVRRGVPRALAARSVLSPSRKSLSLLTELLRGLDLSGRRVLDLGCGRGGSSRVVARHFRAGSVAAVDLIPRSTWTHAPAVPAGVAFLAGDAVALPLRDGSAGVVVCLESSHCYPSASAFLGEVLRVLEPDGVLAWGDLMSPVQFESVVADLAAVGLRVIRLEDVGPGVARAVGGSRLVSRMVAALTRRRDQVSSISAHDGSVLASMLADGRLRYGLVHAVPLPSGGSSSAPESVDGVGYATQELLAQAGAYGRSRPALGARGYTAPGEAGTTGDQSGV